MSDRFVTVASFVLTPEAQMAKNLLESEGIPAFLSSELAAIALSAADEVQLQVRAQDAQRAVRLLAVVAAQASLPDDWESQAESGVWTCPLCGTAVRIGEPVCPSCRTSNPGITTDRRDTWTDPRRLPRETEPEKKSDRIQIDAPRGWRPAVEEDSEPSVPNAGAGCAVLVLIAALAPLWLLYR